MNEISKDKKGTSSYTVNEEEADRYALFSNHWSRSRYHYSGVDEDGVETPVIDMATTELRLHSEIENLSEKERDLILRKRGALMILRGFLSQAKIRAFGAKNSKEIESVVISDKEDELLELFFRFNTLDEVLKTVNVDWGIPVTIKTLALFRERNGDRIKEGQLAYKESIDDLKLVHKRSRLEEYAWLYGIVKDRVGLLENKDDIREASNLLEKIKKEVEGDKIVVEGNLQMDIRQTIDIHTQKEMLGKIPLMQIIIGRISAKQGINPEFMINRLINSSYAKFSGFGGASGDEMRTAEIFLPSQMANYNFENILANRPKLVEEEKKAKIIDIKPSGNERSVKAKKNKLLELIENNRKKIGMKELSVDSAKNNPV